MDKVSRKPAGSFIEDLNAVLKRLSAAQASSSDAELKGMLRQLSRLPIIELGNPVPNPDYLPRKRAARCGASHNRLLLGELGDQIGGDRSVRHYASAAAGMARGTESSSA